MKKILLLSILIPNFAIAEEIIIFSKKLPIPAQKVVKIDAQKLEDEQIVLVQDAFKYVSAINFSRTGGIGTPTNVRIRGAEGDKTLLIIDGQKILDPSLPTGGFDFGQLLLGDVTQIEVLKGIGSSLYGSDAIGGVINIVTTRPKSKSQIRLSLEGGSENTTNVKAQYGNKIGALSYSIYGSKFKTDGVSQFAKKLGGQEKDGFEQDLYGLKAWYEITPNTEIFFKREDAVSKVDFDGYPPPNYTFSDTQEFGESESKTNFLKLSSSIGDNFSHSISLSQVKSDRRNFDPKTIPQINFDSLGRIESFEYLAQYALSKNIGVMGGIAIEKIDYEIAYPSSWDPNPAKLHANSKTKAVFGEANFAISQNLNAKIGVRNDDHNEFGNQTSWHSNIAYRNNGIELHAAISEGFKAPSLYQLYSDYGNTDLEPEIADGFEIGIGKQFDFAKISATYFVRKAKNQIDFFSCWGSTNPKCATRPYGFYDNIAKTKTDGLEFDLSGQYSDFDYSLGGAFIDARNHDANSFDFDNQLARQPKQTAFINLNYHVTAGFKIGLNGQYVSKRRENIYSGFNLAEYDVWNITFAKKLNENFELYGRAENIFDKDYETVKNYGVSGLGFKFGLRVKYN